MNERFADTIVAALRAGLARLGARLPPDARAGDAAPAPPGLSIGFFLHIPFPSSEMYRLLPAREQLLRGLLGADYVSFQIGDYARHFRSSCLRMLGIDSEPGLARARRAARRDRGRPDRDRRRRLPRRRSPTRRPRALLAELEERYEGRRLVLGVERLDYTKGIPQKLQAFERFLEQDPERARTTTMIQVLVPSRLESADYRAQRDEIELQVAAHQRALRRARHDARRVPPPRASRRQELVALYRRADVMTVTPLRDGMNLVAQEFVLCQSAEPALPGRWRGALLLQRARRRRAGAPGRAARQPVGRGRHRRPAHRGARARPARERQRRLETDGGAGRGSSTAGAGPRRSSTRLAPVLPSRARDAAAGRPLDAAMPGALAQTVRARPAAGRSCSTTTGRCASSQVHPDLAAPTPEIRELLARLAALPDTDVHVVSGRRRGTLEQWFGELPVYLCAEHGYLARSPGGDVGDGMLDVDLSWLPRIERPPPARRRRRARERSSSGSRCSVAWHYRQAEPEYGSWRARELLDDLHQHLAGAPAEILAGHQVVEVRALGVDKGVYVRSVFPDGKEPTHFVLGLGDDQTDHDLLDALPSGSVAGHVGGLLPSRRSTNGRREDIHLVGPGEVRAFLRGLTESV